MIFSRITLMYIGMCLHCHWVAFMDNKFTRHLRKHTNYLDNKIDIDFLDIYYIED